MHMITASIRSKWVFFSSNISEFFICCSPSKNMRKSPRSQENRSGRFRSITTFRFWPLNKLKILLNKSKNFIKANFLVGPCLRKKMMRNLSFDQNWETFFFEEHPWIFYMLFPIQKHEEKSPNPKKLIRPISIHRHFQISAI